MPNQNATDITLILTSAIVFVGIFWLICLNLLLGMNVISQYLVSILLYCTNQYYIRTKILSTCLVSLSKMSQFQNKYLQWPTVLLFVETEIPVENHRLVASNSLYRLFDRYSPLWRNTYIHVPQIFATYIYQYILEHAHQYILVHPSIFQYMLVHTSQLQCEN